MSTPSSIEISAERPVPVPTGDVESPSVDVECLTKELPSVEIHVELLGDSEDDDSEDGSNDEEVKKFITRVIKMTLAGEKQSEDPDLPQAEAENQQVDNRSSLLSIQFTDAHFPTTAVRRGDVLFTDDDSKQRCRYA